MTKLFKIEKVYERDIDLLMAQSFINDLLFKDIFLNLLNLKDYKLISVEHSYSDNDGESDLTVILEKDNHKIGLLIEDKIDAIAMPNQYKRYNNRGSKGIQNNLYDKYYIFMIAPQDYLTNNLEAQKYPYKISYEQLQSYFKDNNSYGYKLLESALIRKKKGYSVIEDKEVTEFWKNYYKYVKENYPKLKMYGVKGPRGANAIWPAFLTPIKGIKIQHKSNMGNLDLEFTRIGNLYYEFGNIVNNSLDEDMSIVRTGKSLSIRLEIPIVDFKKDFYDQIDDLKIVYDKSMRLYDLLLRLDTPKIIELMDR